LARKKNSYCSNSKKNTSLTKLAGIVIDSKKIEEELIPRRDTKKYWKAHVATMLAMVQDYK